MKSSSLSKAGLLALALSLLGLAGWEWYARSQSVISYDDEGPLWADKRRHVYEPAGSATVFIGSSRIKYDLDIPTWEALTGEQAVQLAIEGNSPVPVLEDLGNDPAFRGKLVVDITEVLFFDLADYNRDRSVSNVDHFHKETPAQRFSFWVDRGLQSQFVFLDKEYFSLYALLNKIKVPNRPGVWPGLDFPMDFGRITFERQHYMTDRFLADTALQNRVRGIWQFLGTLPGPPPISGAALDSFLLKIKTSVQKIKSRGGQVLFVRTPSSGPYLEAENKAYPRAQYWERLLAETGCPGVHFADYPAIAHFQCPEFSHLSRADAVVFTRVFADILQKEKGWRFPHAPANR